MLKTRLRESHINEFFPRRVVSPSASRRPAPAIPVQRQRPSLSRGWASQSARPPTAVRRSRDYSDCEDSVDSEDGDFDGAGRTPWDPEGGHCRWWGDSDDEQEAKEEAREEQGSNASSARGLGLASKGATASASASAGAAARPAVRSEIAARATAAAERRAAMAATAGTGEGQDPVAARMEEVAPDGGLSGAAAAATAREASAGGPQVPEEAEALVEADDAHAAATEVPAAATPWPCLRKRGSASLFLSQRQRTGGSRGRGVGVGDGGRGTFQRLALSTALANGLRTQRLRLGRTSNSRVGAGVARGEPEGQGIHGRVAGGITCMEFDSQGWHLAVAGENVTVYDFDEYLPKVSFFQASVLFVQGRAK